MTNFILLMTTIAFAQENSTPESSDEQTTEEEISKESEKTEEVEDFDSILSTPPRFCQKIPLKK